MLRGDFTVITGCMFSGKTEELIRLVHRARIARKKVKVFKSVLDQRYSADNVVSHNRHDVVAIPVSSPAEIEKQIEAGDDIIAIDEVQFFKRGIVDHIRKWIFEKGKKVIVAGLNQDSKGDPFGAMPDMLALADDIIKLNAICIKCGNIANKSQRIIYSSEQIDVGSTDKYEARCFACWEPR
jgi:thymidine kinase